MNAKRQSKTAHGHCGKTLLRLEITILKIYNPCNFQQLRMLMLFLVEEVLYHIHKCIHFVFLPSFKLRVLTDANVLKVKISHQQISFCINRCAYDVFFYMSEASYFLSVNSEQYNLNSII